MKKLIIVSGIFFIVLNTVAFLIFSKYALFNNILVSFSIFTAFSMMYILSNKKNADAYRIAMTFVYIFLGLVKIIISLYSNPTFADNFSIIWILGIIFLELILLFSIEYMNKYAEK